MLTLHRAHLGLGLAGVAAYMFLPATYQNVLYLAMSLSVPLAILVGVRRYRPAQTAPWTLMALGFALYVLADAVYTMYEYVGIGAIPFPNGGDVAYLLFYPVVFAALGRFLLAADDRDPTAWLDASIWTLGITLVAWKPVIEPYFTEPSLGGAVSLAYPLLDIGLLLMVLRMVAGHAARTPAYVLLVVGLASQTIVDLVYALQQVQSDFPDGTALDLGWLCTYVAVGSAALHPSMRKMTEPNTRTEERMSGRARLLSLAIPTLVAPVMIVVLMASTALVLRRPDGFVLGLMATIITVLVFARASGLFSAVENRSKELVVRQSQLEATLLERDRIAATLHMRVNRDALTGLASREHFVSALQLALSDGTEPSVAFIDLDDFKTVNDTMGHEVGDLLLVDLAQRLEATVSPADLVSRFGGDEFAVLVKGDVEQVAEQLLGALRPSFIVEDRELRLQVSIGVTTADTESASTGDMLRRADVAMYTAKRAGGGWARYVPGMSSQLRRRVDLRARLVAALRDDEVQPWFQPVVDMRTGELRGFEVLARWVSPTEGVLPPDEWLPVAEETGLAATVDREVGRAGVRQMSAWRARHDVGSLYLSINMSARSIQRRGITEEFLAMLEEHGVPANRIIVEVTESVLIDDNNLVCARLQMLREAGVRVALDDFGTGWSSLSYLQKFPIDQLKLDRSFTAELGLALDGAAIPAAVLQLARALSIDVVAEGVETLDQVERLVELGFDRAQGFLFGEAEPAEQLEPLLARDRPQFAPAALTRRLAALGGPRRPAVVRR